MTSPWDASTFGADALAWSPTIDWHADAICKTVDSGIFFSEKGEEYIARSAKRVCLGDESKGIEACPARERCLNWALDNDEKFGIWGGKSPRQRQNMLAERRRANGGRVRCRVCRHLYVCAPRQLDCSEECRLVSRRRRTRRAS